MALGIGLYLIPLGMIANPNIIELGSAPVLALYAAVKIGLGLGAISYGTIATKSIMSRLILVGVGLLVLFVPAS